MSTVNEPSDQEWEARFAAEALARHGFDLGELNHFFNNANMLPDDLLKAFIEMSEASMAYRRGAVDRAMGILRYLVLVRQNYERLVPLAHKNNKAVTDARAASKKARPGNVDPLRQSILNLMGPENRAGVECKTFLARWEGERIGKLTLTLNGTHYEVSDGDSGASKRYKLSTLTTMYSKS